MWINVWMETKSRRKTRENILSKNNRATRFYAKELLKNQVILIGKSLRKSFLFSWKYFFPRNKNLADMKSKYTICFFRHRKIPYLSRSTARLLSPVARKRKIHWYFLRWPSARYRSFCRWFWRSIHHLLKKSFWKWGGCGGKLQGNSSLKIWKWNLNELASSCLETFIGFQTQRRILKRNHVLWS